MSKYVLVSERCPGSGANDLASAMNHHEQDLGDLDFALGGAGRSVIDTVRELLDPFTASGIAHQPAVAGGPREPSGIVQYQSLALLFSTGNGASLASELDSFTL